MDNLMNFAFNVFWQGVLISTSGFLLLKIFNKWSAPKRSLLASSFLIALVALPLLTFAFMYANIKTIEADNLSMAIFNNNIGMPEIQYNESALPINNLMTDKSSEIKKAEPSANVLPEISSQAVSRAMNIVICVWGTGIVFMLARLFYGLIFLRGFRFGLTLVEDEKITKAMKTALTVFNVKRLPEVYISPKVESPITIGIFKPIMIFPESLYSGFKSNEIKSIILHEFSHIYHYDHLMGLVKRLVVAINWWNPLVYKICSEHSIAREDVSDNYVLSQLKPKIYSECLLELAEKTCLISNLPATVGMADKHISLEQRVKNILSKTRRREMKTRKKIKGIIFGLTCLAAIFIGGVQYTFADNPNEKKQMDLKTYYKFSLKGRKLSLKEVKKLEIKVSKSPDNFEAVAELLGYYFTKYIYDKNIRNKKEKIILNLIANHPESIILAWPEGQLDRVMNNCKPAIALWEAHIKRQPKNIKILWNASQNLFSIDSKSSEKYLKMGQSLEPDNTRWSKELGLLYSFATQQSNPNNALKSYAEYKRVYEQTKVNKLYTILPRLARAAYTSGKYNDADKYAKEMLWRGENNVNAHDILVYNGTYLLGLLALQNGKTEEACKYLLKSGEILNSHKPSLSSPDMTLAYLLLLKDKSEFVTKYLELCFKHRNRNEYKEYLSDIKIGLMPNFRGLYYVKHYGKELLNIYSLRCYKLLDIGKKISAEKANVLEKTIAAIPEKEIRKVKDDITKLLGYYSQKYTKDKNIMTKRRELIFRLIKHYPSSRVLAHPEGQISSVPKDKELIDLWKAQIKKRPEATYILANAASQLSLHDKKLAEQCLKKCQKLNPNNPEWSKKLGLFYDSHKEPKKALEAYKQYKLKTKKETIVKKAKNTKNTKKEMDTRAFYKLYFGGKNLSPAEVKKLEEKVAKNINDSKAVIELLGYYDSIQYTDKGKDIRKKRENLILKFIKNQPESILFKQSRGCLDFVFDDYKTATKLWEAHIKKQPKNLKILWNASRNLLLCDSKSSEKYLKMGQSLEPDNTRWAKQLGHLYSFPTRQSDPKSALKSYEEYKRVYEQTKVNKLYTILPSLAQAAYTSGKYNDADKYAKEMLWRGENTADITDKAIYVYNANYLLGLLALQNGKTKEACKHLIKTGKILCSCKRKIFSPPDMTLAYLLLLKNKHEAVTEYLKLCLQYWDRNEYKEYLADIKAGLMPNFRGLHFANYTKALVNIDSLRCYKQLEIGGKLSVEKAKALEKIVISTPNKKTYKVEGYITELLGYYFPKYATNKDIMAKRRKLIFRLIKYYPYSRVLACPKGKVSSDKKDEELISLWQAQIKKYPKAKYILANAASQLSAHDKKLAEKCLKKCHEIEKK